MKVVRVGLGKRSYSVRVVRSDVSHVAHSISRSFPSMRCALITDKTVAGLYGESVLSALRGCSIDTELLALPAGEATKSSTMLDRVWKWLLDNSFDRNSTLIVALGGGVVGDLAGFAAATYMRGVPYVQVPTTLLSQVDSSVGGKTAINVAGTKNVVGRFHQPQLVYASLPTLQTLQKRQFRNGLGEVVKHGVIRDSGIMDTLVEKSKAVMARDLSVMESLVAESCTVKRDVVQRDELESGERQVLNFGHTFGHAIEAASKQRVHHGEAVALGMVAACVVSEKLGYCDASVREQVTSVLTSLEIGTDISPWWTTSMVDWMMKDKKARGDSVNFIVLKDIGKVGIHSLSFETLRRLIQ